MREAGGSARRYLGKSSGETARAQEGRAHGCCGPEARDPESEQHGHFHPAGCRLNPPHCSGGAVHTGQQQLETKAWGEQGSPSRARTLVLPTSSNDFPGPVLPVDPPHFLKAPPPGPAPPCLKPPSNCLATLPVSLVTPLSAWPSPPLQPSPGDVLWGQGHWSSLTSS